MKRRIYLILALLFSTVPPLSAVISYFPIWAHRSSADALCGFTLLLILLCLLPFYNKLREVFKSPSVSVLWFCLFVLFFLLSRIAYEMTVISFVGFLGNLVGSLFFKLAGGCGDEGQT
jgi:hypothetical protein